MRVGFESGAPSVVQRFAREVTGIVERERYLGSTRISKLSTKCFTNPSSSGNATEIRRFVHQSAWPMKPYNVPHISPTRLGLTRNWAWISFLHLKIRLKPPIVFGLHHTKAIHHSLHAAALSRHSYTQIFSANLSRGEYETPRFNKIYSCPSGFVIFSLGTYTPMWGLCAMFHIEA